jgi:hypothetical protein
MSLLTLFQQNLAQPVTTVLPQNAYAASARARAFAATGRSRDAAAEPRARAFTTAGRARSHTARPRRRSFTAGA